MQAIAHKNEDGAIQTVREHSENTARLCEDFAVDELKTLCRFIGLLHDVGKYQPSFRKRIAGSNIRIEHSVCGAKVCRELLPNSPAALLAELCIAGHHTGLPDCGTIADTEEMTTLYGRLKRQTEDFSAWRSELTLPTPDAMQFNKYLTNGVDSEEDVLEKFAFLVRYCFSCLTDADSLDTAQFAEGENREPLRSSFSACLQKLNEKLRSFHCETPLQKTRAALQQQAFEKIGTDAEIYLMNMPTGSGKTLCSMKFALERAIRTGKRRIIYIIPYNSIIEQTAAVFENLFGDDTHILRHQSTFSYEDNADLDEDYRKAALFAAENWNADIIITTAVQFFESVYGNKRGKLRKLHNTADSILVFDEAHLMPIPYLQPCLRAISCITKTLHSEAVFLTATMPDFAKLFETYSLKSSVVTDLITDRSDFDKFQKCRFVPLGMLSDEELLAKGADAPSKLVVVNTRKAAAMLYAKAAGKKYHLSTYMTAFDRERVLGEIREELQALSRDFPDGNVPPERRITVISTSLIEAGVDLDFYTVFRELSGLDSILQAGGRCNREGKRENADVFIFERTETAGQRMPDERAAVTAGILKEFSDIASPEAIRTYYDRLFFTKRDEIVSHSLTQKCRSLQSIPFDTYSREMRLIDSQTVSVAVAQDDVSRALLRELEETHRGSARKLQKYCFSVYVYEWETLKKQHAVDDFGSGIYMLTNPDYYSAETGVRFEGEDIYL